MITDIIAETLFEDLDDTVTNVNLNILRITQKIYIFLDFYNIIFIMYVHIYDNINIEIKYTIL